MKIVDLLFRHSTEPKTLTYEFTGYIIYTIKSHLVILYKELKNDSNYPIISDLYGSYPSLLILCKSSWRHKML